jgi:hypothetical protein
MLLAEPECWSQAAGLSARVLRLKVQTQAHSKWRENNYRKFLDSE